MEKKVLVVDDERPIVEILKINLQKEGYVVFEAYDGEDAVSKAMTVEPDLILLDVMLPSLTAFRYAKKSVKSQMFPFLC